MQKAFLYVVLAVLTFSIQAAEEEQDKTWKLSAELGVILTTGNTETTSVKGKVDATQELEKWSNQYIFDGLFKEDKVENNDTGEEDTVKTADKYFFSAQGNYKLEKKHDSLFVYGSHLKDQFGPLADYTVVSVGYGTRLYESESSYLDADIGPGYASGEKQGDGETPGESIDGMILRANAEYEWQISKSAKFTQKLSVNYGSDNTVTKSETALTAKINGSMQMKAGFNVTNNSDVDADKENTDTETFVTLVFNF
ncbi:DUF481 domain-containing protein [Flocculibacter collagenilyticus]|uniref:DUF481 domain-containing protein n=1 Tax=Flocculibacter collagenilyticus TaxID=2744479 RepID=UPI0018F35DCA|nr:DUF481 domain-containing protein [Flocculibacter collagenilyticus]